MAVVTPSTTFVNIDTLQSPFTTVVLSTIGFQGQTVTIFDRTASASVAQPIVISSVTAGISTTINQPSGFITLHANGTSWSYLNTFPFWNQEISSGVSFLTTSSLYTSVNSTIFENIDNVIVENLLITGPFLPTESETVIQRMLTVTGHTDSVSSFKANASFTISSFLSTFSTLFLASSLMVGGSITIQSTLTTLSSLYVSSSVNAVSISTGFLTVGGHLLLSSIEIQQSTGQTVNLGGNLIVQQDLNVLSSATIGGSVATNTFFVGSSLSTIGTLAVEKNLFISSSVSTGSLFQGDSLTIQGLTQFYDYTTITSSITAYSATIKNSLYLDTSLEVSTASIQMLRADGTLTMAGQTHVDSHASTLQNLNARIFMGSSSYLVIKGGFSSLGSFTEMANMITTSSIYIQGSISTQSTLTVAENTLFQGAVQVNGTIAFTSSLRLLSSLNVLNTLSVNTLTLSGNLNAASTVTVSGPAQFSSLSLPLKATVNEIMVVSSFFTSVLSTPTVNYSSKSIYTSSIGIGYASSPYNFQIPYMISSQSLNVSSFLSTSQLILNQSLQISTSLAVAMDSLGPGLDVAGLAKVNGSIYAFQTINSHGVSASNVTAALYGDAIGISNLGLEKIVSSVGISISSTFSSIRFETNTFMGSSGSIVSLITNDLKLQGTTFLEANTSDTLKYVSTNRIQAHPSYLQLNNSIFIMSTINNQQGRVGINTSEPQYSLHVNGSLGVAGIAGADIPYRSIHYDSLFLLYDLTNTTDTYISSGLIELVVFDQNFFDIYLTTTTFTESTFNFINFLDSLPKYLLIDSSSNTYYNILSTNTIRAKQSTLILNDFVYIGPSTVGIGVSSPTHALETHSFVSSSNLTSYTTEVETSIELNRIQETLWTATGYTDYSTYSNMRFSYDGGLSWNNADDSGYYNITKGTAYNGSFWITPGNPIMTSQDGIVWDTVEREGGSGSFITGGGKVAWNGSYWVATGPSSNQQGTLLKSEDGFGWSNSLSGGFTSSAVLFQGSDVLWTGNKWIATGLGENNLSSIQWSEDGMNWSSITSGGFLLGGNTLSFGPTLPYVVGKEEYQGNSLLFAVGNDPFLSSIQYSIDGGYSWNPIDSGGFSTRGNGIDTDGKYLVAVGTHYNSPSNIQIGYIQENPWRVTFESYASFTGGSILDYINRGNCVKWNGSEWLLGGDLGVRRLTTTSNSYFSSFTVSGTTSYEFIVAVPLGANRPGIYSINGGNTWTKEVIINDFLNYFIETNGSNMWVMFGIANPPTRRPWYSTDGISWNLISNFPFVYSFGFGGVQQEANDLRYFNNRWFLAMQEIPNSNPPMNSSLASSVDGINWSNIIAPNSSNVTVFLYGDGTYVAGSPGSVKYSYDLTTWTSGSGNFNIPFKSAGTFGNGIFLIGGQTEYNVVNYDPTLGTRPLIRSTDGINWSYVYSTSFQTIPYDATFQTYSIAYSPVTSTFVLGANTGYASNIFYSSNGSDWYASIGIPAYAGTDYNGISWTGLQFTISLKRNNNQGTYNSNFPFYYSSDGQYFSQGSGLFGSVAPYAIRGFIKQVPVNQTEFTSFGYTSNPNPLVNVNTFSIFTDTDINTVHSQASNNTLLVTSNTLVFNDIFTITDKIVNIGNYPLDPTLTFQSSLSIFETVEITGSLSTGSASISSLYLGIQSV